MAIKPIQYSDSTKHYHAQGTERLTAYEFNCGYVQQVESPSCTVNQGIQLQMWKEHGVFHVRAHDFSKSERIFWDSFQTMTQATRRYFKAKRELGLKQS